MGPPMVASPVSVLVDATIPVMVARFHSAIVACKRGTNMVLDIQLPRAHLTHCEESLNQENVQSDERGGNG